MKSILIVGCGGFLGAVLRYLVSIYINSLYVSIFPIATLTVNFVGAFFIGFVSQFFIANYEEKRQLLLFLQTGILGGFTTFSTFSLETVNLMQSQNSLIAIFNILISITGGILGVLCGKIVANKII